MSGHPMSIKYREDTHVLYVSLTYIHTIIFAKAEIYSCLLRTSRLQNRALESKNKILSVDSARKRYVSFLLWKR